VVSDLLSLDSVFVVCGVCFGARKNDLIHSVFETRLKKELAEKRKKRTKKKKKKKVGQKEEKEERILEQSTRGGILCAMS